MFLYGVVAETFEAYRRSCSVSAGNWLILLHICMGSLEIEGLDLNEEIRKKQTKNENRVYEEKNGVNYRIND